MPAHLTHHCRAIPKDPTSRPRPSRALWSGGNMVDSGKQTRRLPTPKLAALDSVDSVG